MAAPTDAARAANPLLALPQDYRDLSLAHVRLDEIPVDGPEAPKRLLYAACEAVELRPTRGGDPMALATLCDGERREQVALFRGQWEQGGAEAGRPILMRVRRRLVNGEARLANADVYPPWAHGRVIALHKGRSGHASALEAHALAAAALADGEGALREAVDALRERLPGRPRAYLRRAGSPRESYGAWLSDLHAPRTAAEGLAARECGLKLAAMDLLTRAGAGQAPAAGEPMRLPKAAVERAVRDVEAHSGFALSRAQRGVVSALAAALAAGDRRILLHGEVGSGKTYVFLPVAAAAARAGHRVHLMSPNRLLAAQTHAVAKGAYPDLAPQLVASGRAKAAAGRLLIGTQALLRLAERPDFAVVDEEQKVGAEQKRAMEAGRLLEVSATPLPRTLAIARLGGRRLLSLPARSADRRIECRIEEPDGLRPVMDAIRADLAQGVNVAVIYPHAKRGYGSVDEARSRWERAMPGDVISLHGQLDAAARNAALLRVLHPPPGRRARGAVILATSILEIGVTLPNLKRMVVYGPDRQGASSLHQMRGRLCRQGGEGVMHLLLPKPAERMPKATMERLRAVQGTASGAEVAAADADRRGFGELRRMGLMQSGKDDDPLLAGADPSLQDLLSVMRPQGRGRRRPAPAPGRRPRP